MKPPSMTCPHCRRDLLDKTMYFALPTVADKPSLVVNILPRICPNPECGKDILEEPAIVVPPKGPLS